jgi:hypothetical protein
MPGMHTNINMPLKSMSNAPVVRAAPPSRPVMMNNSIPTQSRVPVNPVNMNPMNPGRINGVTPNQMRPMPPMLAMNIPTPQTNSNDILAMLNKGIYLIFSFFSKKNQSFSSFKFIISSSFPSLLSFENFKKKLKECLEEYQCILLDHKQNLNLLMT